MAPRADDWTCNLCAGQPLSITPTMPLIITNATLAKDVAEENRRSCLQYQYTPSGAKATESVVVASFFKNRCDSKLLKLKLNPGCNYVLSIHGPNDIDLIGYYNPESIDRDEVASPPSKPKALAPVKETRAVPLAKTRSRTKASAKSPDPPSAALAIASNIRKGAGAKKPIDAVNSKAAGKRKAPDDDSQYQQKIQRRKDIDEEDAQDSDTS